MQTKKCYKCKEHKPTHQFYAHPTTRDGLTSYCVTCYRAHYRSKYQHKMSRRGIVYCLECEGFYKFGITRNGIKKRLAPIRSGNPFEVNLLWVARTNDTGKYERMIHDKIKDSHVRGEWYAIPRLMAKELKNMVTHDDV